MLKSSWPKIRTKVKEEQRGYWGREKRRLINSGGVWIVVMSDIDMSASKSSKYGANFKLMTGTDQIHELQTLIRDVETSRSHFKVCFEQGFYINTAFCHPSSSISRVFYSIMELGRDPQKGVWEDVHYQSRSSSENFARLVDWTGFPDFVPRTLELVGRQI